MAAPDDSTAALDESVWLVSEASATGHGHLGLGLPNQDSVCVRTSANGRLLVAAVSDGAGTARRSAEGSRLATGFMTDWLLRAAEQSLASSRGGRIGWDAATWRTRVVTGITELRQRIDPTGQDLRSFHCTLVASVLGEHGGVLVQIGDSVALSARTRLHGTDAAGAQVDFFDESQVTIHLGERGEYANETHFLTEPDWEQHLSVTPLPADLDTVMLMTDGAADVALLRGRVFKGFCSNLVGRLLTLKSRAQRCATLLDWLSSRQTHAVTADDKTMLVALRTRQLQLAGRPVHLGEATNPPETASTSAPATAPGPLQLPAQASVIPARKTATGTKSPRTLIAVLGTLVLLLGASTGWLSWTLASSHGAGQVATASTTPPASPASPASAASAASGTAPWSMPWVLVLQPHSEAPPPVPAPTHEQRH